MISSIALFSQVDFQHEFTCPKVDQFDELVRIWIDDIDEDGFDEIYAGYRYGYNLDDYYRWRIVTYDQSGNIIRDFLQEYNQYRYISYCSTFTHQNLSYFAVAVSNSTDIIIEIYNFVSLELVTSFTVTGGVNFIEPIIIQDTLTLHIGTTIHEYFFSDPVEDTTLSSKLYKITFMNENLELQEIIDNCGRSIAYYNDSDLLLTTGLYYHLLHVPGHAHEWERKTYLKHYQLRHLPMCLKFFH